MKLWFERGAWASKRGRKAIAAMAPEQVRRIAVIRHAALGDMVLVRPFLIEARQFFPHAKIVLSLVSNYTYGAPEELVDEVHILHGNEQKNISIKQRIARAKELGPVDILFDLADTTRSRYLCFLADAKIKIGFPYRWYLRNLLLDAAVPRSDFCFEAINMLDALMLLGANPTIPPDFGWRDRSQQVSAAPKRTILYFPFASISSKAWPKQSFVELIERLSIDYPTHDHVVLGGITAAESIQDWAVHFERRSNVRCMSAVPLAETMRLLDASAAVISNDTGIRNVAIARGTPTVGIFFSTVPYRYWPRYGRHAAAFCANGTIPDVGQVMACVAQLMR